MNAQGTFATAALLLADDKGLLAMNESNATCNERSAKMGIAPTTEVRRDYREWLVTTPGLGQAIKDVIMYDKTIRQTKSDSTPLVHAINELGIQQGIKVDTCAKDMAGYPGEKMTEGLVDLRDRLCEYSNMGAHFAKWRLVIAIGEGIGMVKRAVRCAVFFATEADVDVIAADLVMIGNV